MHNNINVLYKLHKFLDKKRKNQKQYERTILNMSFLKEFWEFLIVRKKYWLLPTIIVLVLFGGLIILSHVSAVAPFIYTIF